MLESLNDYLSLAVMLVFCVIGIVLLVSFLHSTSKNRSTNRKESYFAFWKDISDGRDEKDDDLFYF
ncbi:MAG: hypothetical protein SOI44_01590 [Lactimicrobium sp.]|jgi:hypothetical protein|uniref:hypothetical protein n=1 Tax=Lactimicrobium sp. TaxID=2563780 RepID=UPI002F359A36